MNGIRKATKKDNEELLNLLKNCPMKDGFEFYIDRSPDFFKLYEIQDCDYKVLVYIRDEKIVGVIGSLVKDVFIDGKEEQVVMIGDLYILPEFRKGRILPRLMKEIIDQNKDKYSLGMSSYEEENFDSIATAKGRMGFPAGELLCEYNLYSLIPIFKIKTKKELEFVDATEADISEMVNLYNEYYKNFDFAPKYTNKSLLKIIKDTPNLDFLDFKLCKHNGKIIAISALWEASDVQKMVVSKLGFIFKILSILISLLSLIPGYRGKQFKSKTPVNFLWHCFNAYKEEDDFLQLLYNINNKIRKSNYLLSFITFDSNDNINSKFKKLLKTKMRHKVFFFSIREGKGTSDFINKDRYKYIDYTYGI